MAKLHRDVSLVSNAGLVANSLATDGEFSEAAVGWWARDNLIALAIASAIASAQLIAAKQFTAQ